MSQHDLSIADQSAPLFRADLNNALAALGSLQSGGTAPALPYNSLLWYDTATDILKIGNEAGDAFYPVGYMNNSAGSFDVVDGTKVSTTAGVVVGSLAVQSEATWVAGVGTTETLISPAKLKAAVLVNSPPGGWEFVSVIYDYAISGASGTRFESSDLEDGYDYRLIVEDIEGRPASGGFVRFYMQDTSLNWVFQTIAGPSSFVYSVALCREITQYKPGYGVSAVFASPSKIKRFAVQTNDQFLNSGRVTLQKIASTYV
jgi:hypothetical protein